MKGEYLIVIMDWYSRYVLARRISNSWMQISVWRHLRMHSKKINRIFSILIKDLNSSVRLSSDF
jgi:hypothetical protein